MRGEILLVYFNDAAAGAEKPTWLIDDDSKLNFCANVSAGFCCHSSSIILCLPETNDAILFEYCTYNFLLDIWVTAFG